MTPRSPRAIPMRYGSRYGSPIPPARQAAGCRLCAAPLPSARARYCSEACKQRAYRLRRADAVTPDRPPPAAGLGRLAGRPAPIVYACPRCDERYLGERRCPDCNRFCRKLGPGGACPHCDEPILLAELLGKEVLL